MAAKKRKYIDEREASTRYSYSRKWFQMNRWKGGGPPFLKLPGSSKILYPLKETDAWFEQHGLQKSTSDNLVKSLDV